MIFELALRRDAVEPKDCLMVGNKWNTDIIGAETIGMLSYFKNKDTFSDLLKYLKRD
jgi:FMN phosphatase YigB (HAD superfamily)